MLYRVPAHIKIPSILPAPYRGSLGVCVPDSGLIARDNFCLHKRTVSLFSPVLEGEAGNPIPGHQKEKLKHCVLTKPGQRQARSVPSLALRTITWDHVPFNHSHPAPNTVGVCVVACGTQNKQPNHELLKCETMQRGHISEWSARSLLETAPFFHPLFPREFRGSVFREMITADCGSVSCAFDRNVTVTTLFRSAVCCRNDAPNH